MKNRRIPIFLTIFFIVLAACFLYFATNVIDEFEKKKPALPMLGNDHNHHVQPFSFINQDGITITEQTTKGKICVVEYFFATCKGICPKMNENMRIIYDAYKGNNDVLILSHTVDPQKDSVAALKAYSNKFKADAQHWMFLTGDKKQLYEAARFSYLINAQQDTAGLTIDKDFIHDKHFVLVDRIGRIRGFYDGLEESSMNTLIVDIKTLLREKE